MSSSKVQRALRDIIDSRQLYSTLNDVCLEAIVERFSAAFREQNHGEEPPDDPSIPFFVQVDINVVRAFVDEIASAVARKVESMTVNV